MAQERIALVTGGTRGIGAAISAGLKAKGYKVAANYGGNDEAANAFKAETGIPVFKFDVGDAAACEAGIKAVEAEVGPIDILVNNAGITRDGAFHKMTFEKWQAVIKTNLDSMFTCTRPVIEGMRARNFGRIILISSINGQKGQAGQTNYSAAKAGVIGFAKALAQESASKGITVNVIAPGYIATDHGDGGAGRYPQQDHLDHPRGPPRRGRGDRARGGISRGGRFGLHHRLDPDDQRRPVHRLTPPRCIDEKKACPGAGAGLLRFRRPSGFRKPNVREPNFRGPWAPRRAWPHRCARSWRSRAASG